MSCWLRLKLFLASFFLKNDLVASSSLQSVESLVNKVHIANSQYGLIEKCLKKQEERS